MSEINTLLAYLQPLIRGCTFRQLTLISEALLMMHGRITMLGISRWTTRGGSYRTIQRFFMAPINWAPLNWQLIKRFALKDSGVILIAGDATTVTKSGKETFGLGRFFSSIYSRAVPGISFQVLSLIDVERACSWPVLLEQMMPKPRPVKPKRPAKPTGKQPARPRGRPKGSKNKNRRDVELNTEMKQVQGLLKQLLTLIGETLKPVYFVYDGAFGNNAAVQMTRQTGLHLISKLRNNSALYFQWQGVYAGKGARRRYGERVDYTQLPNEYLSHAMMRQNGESSILDLKARYHGLRYAQEAFKILPQKAEVIKFEDWIKKIPILGMIHEQVRAA